MSTKLYHTSVLLKESLEGLNVQAGCKYIDATLGGGGHTKEILSRGGVVLGIDVDPDAVSHVRSLHLENLTIAVGNYSKLKELAQQNGFANPVGILFDLGMSSHQLEGSGRGFSFQKEEPLDMRMDLNLQVTAADLLNVLSKKELNDLFIKYGEEALAGLYSTAIVHARRLKRLETTQDLVQVMAQAHSRVSRSRGRIHPATKVFQALRIAVNDELNQLQEGLDQAVEILQSRGRLVVISFHSLEDRLVKGLKTRPELREIGGLIVPTESEQAANPRSSSAKLRIYEKN